VITELVFLLLGMALMKGIVEPLVATQTQRLAKKYVPLLLDKLDPVMPVWISSMSETELRGAIFQSLLAIEPKLTPRQQEQILTHLRREYDPIINSRKVDQNAVQS